MYTYLFISMYTLTGSMETDWRGRGTLGAGLCGLGSRIPHMHTHIYTCTYRHAGGRLVRPGLKDLFRRPHCGGPEALLHFRLPYHRDRLGCGRGDGVRGCCGQRFVHNRTPSGWCDVHLDRLCGQVLRPQCFSAACSCVGVVVRGLSSGETKLLRWHSFVREGHGRGLAGCASVAKPACEKTITIGADMVIALPKCTRTRTYSQAAAPLRPMWPRTLPPALAEWTGHRANLMLDVRHQAIRTHATNTQGLGQAPGTARHQRRGDLIHVIHAVCHRIRRGKSAGGA